MPSNASSLPLVCEQVASILQQHGTPRGMTQAAVEEHMRPMHGALASRATAFALSHLQERRLAELRGDNLWHPLQSQTPTERVISTALSPQEGLLYRALVEAGGRFLSREALVKHVWAQTAVPPTASNIVGLLAFSLRRKLAITAPHIRLVGRRGQGYAIARSGEPIYDPAEARPSYLLWRGEYVRLRPNEVAVYNALLATHPQRVVRPALLAQLEQRLGHRPTSGNLDVILTNMRARLPGLLPPSKWGKGWCLASSPDPVPLVTLPVALPPSEG